MTLPVANSFATKQLPDTHYQTLGNWRCRPVLPARFFRKVRFANNGCWIWIGSRWGLPGYYYGQIRVGEKRKCAHAFAYEIVIGDIPQDKELDHLCNNKLCVNPNHLEVVTHKENCVRRAARVFKPVLTSLLLVALLTPAPHQRAHMFGLADIAQKFYAQLPLNFEPLVTGAESKTEVTSIVEPAALPAVLAQIAKKHQSFTDRVMARLSEAERREINTHYQADYRQSWICLSFANRGIGDPFVSASYQMYGIHPDKVWERIVADRKARLGAEYFEWYSSDDILRPDVPRLPPRKAESTADGAALSTGMVGGSVPNPRKEIV